MAISRILSAADCSTRMIIYLTQSRNRGTSAGESRGRRTVMRRYPRIITDRLSSLCFVLHHMGFFLPRELLRER